MRTAAVIGWPVAHSLSPRIHRFWLRALGLDGDYARLAVAPDNLRQAVQALPALGLAGVNVTIPHKVAVLPYLDEISDVAREVGAVNTITVDGGRRLGTNTDVAGFLEPLQGVAIERAAVIGAGGAARAVLVGLRQLGVRHITLCNRSQPRAEALLAGLGIEGEVRPLGAPLPAVDLLVNATSLGMAGQPPLAVDLRNLPDGACVYDIVYAPPLTPLLQAAATRGLRSIDGLRMLVGQAAPAFRLFYGAAPPRELDGELRRILLEGQA